MRPALPFFSSLVIGISSLSCSPGSDSASTAAAAASSASGSTASGSTVSSSGSQGAGGAGGGGGMSSSSAAAGGAAGSGGQGAAGAGGMQGQGGAAAGAGGMQGQGGAATGAGGMGGTGTGGGMPAPLFDMPMIHDTATAQCSFANPHTVLDNGVLLDVWNVSYISWESIGGQMQPIVIRGFAAKPNSQSANLPGVVQAHGLGGFAEEKHATGLAAQLGMFVIAYTGPGGGNAPDNTSEGLPSGDMNGYRMFDTLTDTRGSWFWGHAVAAMRGITCLETRSEVDKARLGMTGFSAGGVVTLISAGVDDRVKAAVPLSGTHAWSVATQSPKAWQHTLLAQAGLSISSPEWLKLQSDIIDPAATVALSQSKVLMVNGSTDEFFPLTAHNATYDAIPGSDKRMSIAGNFDHGCYPLTGVESAQTIEDRATLRASGGQRMWFSHWFGTSSNYTYLPLAPVVQVQAVGQATFVTAVVDSGGPDLLVEEVKIWASNDDSFIYGGVVLDPAGNGVYSKLVAFPLQPNTISFVDAQYKTKALINPERFSLSSEPVIPAGLVPHIRDIGNCL
jgi:cephalosporin-C deacetylase-like acetyl esterase